MADPKAKEILPRWAAKNRLFDRFDRGHSLCLQPCAILCGPRQLSYLRTPSTAKLDASLVARCTSLCTELHAHAAAVHRKELAAASGWFAFCQPWTFDLLSSSETFCVLCCSLLSAAGEEKPTCAPLCPLQGTQLGISVFFWVCG